MAFTLRMLLAAAVLALPATTGTAQPERLAVGGVERTYVLHRPMGVPPGGPMPLVLVLHGGGGRADRLRTWLGMDGIADRERFAVAYPDGRDGHWNDGRKDFPRRTTGAPSDDVAFLAALARRLNGNGLGTPATTFVAGVSNGGMMTFRLACETDGVFAGFAAAIANLPQDLEAMCKPAGPRPMLILNGTADPLVPWAGGGVGFAGRRGTVISTPATFALWQRVNGCAGAPVVAALPDLDAADGTTVTLATAQGCRAATLLYTIERGGHQLPSLSRERAAIGEMLVGPGNRDLDSAEAIWRFFAGLVRGQR